MIGAFAFPKSLIPSGFASHPARMTWGVVSARRRNGSDMKRYGERSLTKCSSLCKGWCCCSVYTLPCFAVFCRARSSEVDIDYTLILWYGGLSWVRLFTVYAEKKKNLQFIAIVMQKHAKTIIVYK